MRNFVELTFKPSTMFKFIVTVIFFLLTATCFSQRNCGTEIYHQDIVTQYPELAGRYGRIDPGQALIEKTNQLKGVIKIPVVVHVVYKDSVENISDAEIAGTINALNLDFAGRNDDHINIPAAFQNKAADCEIAFELVKVTRTKTNVPKFLIQFHKDRKGKKIFKRAYEPIKFSALSGVDAFSCTQFLNIWVGNITDGSVNELLGYASFPGGLCEYDGVVINYKYFGVVTGKQPFNKGRTLTHEVGHYLNLRHIWGDEDCGNDFIDDTPTQQKDNSGCPAFPSVSCTNSPDGDMFMNFMDYVNDECMNMFTLKQKIRMRSLFVEGGDRSYFLSSTPANRTVFLTDTKRSDLYTPAITEFKKYWHCRPVTDTCRYAFVFWTVIPEAVEYKVMAKKLSSNTWEVINTTNNYIKLAGLNSHQLYEVKVQSILKNGIQSSESIPYIFKLKGINPTKFKKLKLIV